jgi:hypothetical protein
MQQDAIIRRLTGGSTVLTKNLAKPQSNIFKTISWILAYAVWIFIFLIPVVGIVVIVMYLLKNQKKTRGH